MDRAEDLRSDYDRLGALLASETDGAKAAALVRERRMLGELLAGIEKPKEPTVADQLAPRRGARTGAAGASRRRQSG